MIRAKDTDPVSQAVIGWLRDPAAQRVARDVRGWDDESWRQARYLTQVHGVAPLLHALLTDSDALDLLRSPLREYLADQRRQGGARARRIDADLRRIVEAADAAGVELMPLKGSVLTRFHYQDPALRPMADLDLLVRPDDEPGLTAVLQRLGYRLTEATFEHRTFRHREQGDRVASTEGEHPQNPLDVELHTAVSVDLLLLRWDLTKELWARSSPGFYSGGQGRRLSDLGLLLHLLGHNCRNLFAMFFRVIQLHDLQLLAPGLGPEGWARLVDLAREGRAERVLFAPLYLAREVLGLQVPGRVLQALSRGTPPDIPRMLDRIDVSGFSMAREEAAVRNKLKWFYPGKERRQALARYFVPGPEELRRRYSHVTGEHPLLAGYLAHAQNAIFGLLSRLLGLRRAAWRRRLERG